MAIDQLQGLLYSSDDQKRILASYNLQSFKLQNKIKLANSYPTRLKID